LERAVRIAVSRETEAGEPRVAATPETVRKLKALGAEVAVARGAGAGSGIPDVDSRRRARPSETAPRVTPTSC
jgi:NAD/NADP transhydrogenase alpha subunit